MKTKILALLLSVLMLVCVMPFAAVGAVEGIEKSDHVIFVANAGSDDNAGTLEAPVATMQKAVEKLQIDGGVVVIIGQVTINAENAVMPAHNGVITVTSCYDGVDYRANFYNNELTGARLIFNNGDACAFALQGDYVFDYLDICINTNKKQCLIACYYNDVTFGANVKTVFEGFDGTPWYEGSFACDEYPAVDPRKYPPIIITGWNVEDAQGAGNVVASTTITEPATINIAGGTWYSVRVGDRNVPYRNTVDAVMTLNISGGVFTYWSTKFENANTNLCVMGHYQVSTGENFVSNINITGGTFMGEIGGFGIYGTASKGDPFQNGVVNINITGGSFKRYATDNYGPVVIPTQYLPLMYANLRFGENARINVNIDPTNITVESFAPYISVLGAEEMVPVFVNITQKSEKIVIEEDVPVWDVTYAGVPAGTNPVETEALTTTEAPKTEAPVTTEPQKTDAPKTEGPKTEPPKTEPPVTEMPDVQPPSEETSPALTIVLLASVAVIAAIAVIVIIKKKKS